MRSILVVNPKGGCGKTTLATNLAGFYANKGLPVALVDMDQQRSSHHWVGSRDESLPKIHSYLGDTYPGDSEFRAKRVVYDCPAQIHIGRTTDLVNKADVIIMPINPSIIDQRAALEFIMDVRAMMRAKVCQRLQIGLVANRAGDGFRSYEELQRFSKMMNAPIVGSLRNTQNYVTAASAGKSLFDMPKAQVVKDLEQWRGVCYWAEGKVLKPKEVEATFLTG